MGREIRQRTLALISAAAATTSGTALAAGGGFVTVHFRTGLSLLIGGAIVALVPAVLLTFSDIRHARIEERRRALRCFVELTHQLIKMDKEHELRVTLLEVDTSKNPHLLRQVARFTSDGARPAGKTIMSIQQGAAGRCYNKGKNVIVNLDGDDYIEQMFEF